MPAAAQANTSVAVSRIPTAKIRICAQICRSTLTSSELPGDGASIKATSVAVVRSTFWVSCMLSAPSTLIDGHPRSSSTKPSRCNRTLLTMNTLICTAAPWLVSIGLVDPASLRKFHGRKCRSRVSRERNAIESARISRDRCSMAGGSHSLQRLRLHSSLLHGSGSHSLQRLRLHSSLLLANEPSATTWRRRLRAMEIISSIADRSLIAARHNAEPRIRQSLHRVGRGLVVAISASLVAHFRFDYHPFNEFVAGDRARAAVESPGLTPLRERSHGVHIVVDDIRVGILLPAAGHGIGRQIARTAQFVDRMKSEIQRLPGFVRQGG